MPTQPVLVNPLVIGFNRAFTRSYGVLDMYAVLSGFTMHLSMRARRLSVEGVGTMLQYYAQFGRLSLLFGSLLEYDPGGAHL